MKRWMNRMSCVIFVIMAVSLIGCSSVNPINDDNGYDVVVGGSDAGYAQANGNLGQTATTTTTTEPEEKIKSGIAAQFKDGVYTAIGQGRNGDVVVTATVENGYITSIVAEHQETESKFALLEKKLMPKIIYEQSADVDAISGVTYSSNAVKEAMKLIMEEAKK